VTLFRRREKVSKQPEVQIPFAVRAGNLQIPGGKYTVRLDEGAQTVILSGEGREFQLTPFPRSSKMRVSNDAVQLRNVMGEPAMLLILRTPPANEWVVRLEKQSGP